MSGEESNASRGTYMRAQVPLCWFIDMSFERCKGFLGSDEAGVAGPGRRLIVPSGQRMMPRKPYRSILGSTGDISDILLTSPS